jgi:3-dehydroquinate synthetase
MHTFSKIMTVKHKETWSRGLEDCDILLFDKNLNKHKSIVSMKRSAKNFLAVSSSKAKNLKQAQKLWTFFSSIYLTKKSVVVVAGGGSILDLCAFALSLWHRGVPWISIPTTYLAQYDSAYGGKTAVDLSNAKNILGTFHPPKEIRLSSEWYKTLSQFAQNEGLAEYTKHLLLLGKKIQSHTPSVFTAASSLRMKKKIIAHDLLDELGHRALLNLGHTVAHALEAMTKGEVSHGEALWFGLWCELKCSDQSDSVKKTRELASQKTNIKKWAKLFLKNEKKIENLIRLDKKNIHGQNTIGLVTLKNKKWMLRATHYDTLKSTWSLV